jgi:hypothetical protein
LLKFYIQFFFFSFSGKHIRRASKVKLKVEENEEEEGKKNRLGYKI